MKLASSNRINHEVDLGFEDATRYACEHNILCAHTNRLPTPVHACPRGTDRDGLHHNSSTHTNYPSEIGSHIAVNVMSPVTRGLRPGRLGYF